MIHLDSDDDIISICDRLNWQENGRASGQKRTLLHLPPDGGVLREGLDLVRLRRHADRQRIEIGLITPDAEIRRQAAALGIPVFLTAEAAERSRRGWWRGRRRRERVGLPTVGGSGVMQVQPQPLAEGDRREVHRRMRTAVSWQRWLLRYAAIVIFFITLALLAVAFVYAVPSATITLKPAGQPVRVTRVILADPNLETVDYAQGAVPARRLTVQNSWQATAPTTGAAAVPNAAARGKVLFVNLRDEEVTIPAGTRVSTSDGSNVIFQTIAEVTTAAVEGSTAEVDIIAIEPGPQGNVAANLVNRIEGPLATQLEVRNLEAMEGGAVREVTAVSEADQIRLRAQVLQFLQALAASEMEAQLTEREFLARPSLQVVQINSETYSHFVGEQTEKLTLEMRAALIGTVINTTDATGLLYEALATAVPANYTLNPDNITLSVGDVVGVDEDGRVTFEMIAEGTAVADLNTSGAVQAITGQQPEVALAYLYEQLPLRDVPSAQIWPLWFQRIPYLPARIQVEVQNSES
ncbi:MAG: baseplate J/gp47 family protein [Ardenticatenaceae bacterium]|nr:baseplate J/gp47 family protein [Ardenticatenaceae bacterium]MCB9005061.1 baseplate J/gp47 family protein [Ardenticatenaceae bacterium]